MLFDGIFTKENLDAYLKELSKEYRRINGNKVSIEIILIGGASILANYTFRGMTYDIDAIIEASSSFKEAVNHVGDKFNLPNGWLNADFVKTDSYSPKLILFSKYYKTFSNILNVRVVSSEYLVAMKLMSGRQYKCDLSDVVGVIIEQKQKGEPISFDDIKRAAKELYGGFEKIPDISKKFIEKVYETDDLESLYNNVRQSEKENRSLLIEFEKNYKNVLKEDNVNEVIQTLRNKKYPK